MQSETATQQVSDQVMMPLTPAAQIDELRRAIGEAEQRRQAAEVKLADRERQLGTARQTIAAQDQRIGRVTAELARLRGAATATVLNAYALDFPQLFKSTRAG
jgi:chromosome segregation ATPase